LSDEVLEWICLERSNVTNDLHMVQLMLLPPQRLFLH